MALALRVRVTWQGDVIEDGAHRASVLAVPGKPEKVVHFRRPWTAALKLINVALVGLAAITVGGQLVAAVARDYRMSADLFLVAAIGSTLALLALIPMLFVRGLMGLARPGGYRLQAPAGALTRIEFPGEEPIDARQGFDKRVRSGVGKLVIEDASEIEFQLLKPPRDFSTLFLFGGLAVVAMLALAAGSFYHIVRQWGDGHTPRWGEPVALGADQAKFLRVTIDPGAQGASKLAAGEGLARHGIASSLLVRDTRPKPKVEPVVAKKPVAKKKKVIKIEPVEIDPDSEKMARTTPAPKVDNPPTDDDDEADDDDDADDADETADHDKLVQTGQQALLAAELRSAIDSLTAAEKTDHLDYDNLNWIGLAHYFLGENDQAQGRWQAAYDMDPARPDAVNNLGGIYKRKGDTASEITMYDKALALHPGDCHALNSKALALAKQGRFDDAYKTLAESDVACGGNYAYTFIQRAGILSLEGKQADSLAELEKGLAKVDTLIPIKEYEVEADLLLDPAFAKLRAQPSFDTLTARYLPRAVQSKQAILSSLNKPATPPNPPIHAAVTDLKDPFAND